MKQTFREWLREKERIEAEQINEMAPTYTPKETGLKEIIWVSAKMASHGPRIKVYEVSKGPNFSVSIEDDPKVVAGNVFCNNKELNKIFDFVKKYKNELIGYWNSTITEDELDNVLILKKKQK